MLCYLRPSPRLLLRPIQRCAYSSAPSPIKTKDYKAAHSGFIRVLTLDRPEARNAISKAMLAALKEEVQKASSESESGRVRALIIASADDASFCAGADLKERATFTQQE
jgi:methylglutaconyl-CoA hydratase